jgi:DNA-binding Lrp family transcriptional regulator
MAVGRISRKERVAIDPEFPCRGVTRTTVLNLVDRLEKRGWLKRESIGGVYRYRPTLDRASASRMVGWAFVTVPAAAVDQPLAAEAFVAAAAPRPLRKPVAVADGEFALPDSIDQTPAASLRMPTFREVASCLL